MSDLPARITTAPLGFGLLGGRGYDVAVNYDRLEMRGPGGSPFYAIPLADITDIRVADDSYETRVTPTWAVVLAVIGAFVFLLGLLFLLVKETRREVRSTVTVYTATAAYPFSLHGATPQQAYDRWYPLFAATGRHRQ